MSADFDTAAPPPQVKGGANRESWVRQQHYEIDRDQWGRYKLPDLQDGQLRAYRRATTLARTLTDEFTLNQWRTRKVIEGLVRRQDLYALACATEPEETGALNKISDQATEYAEANSGANNGTALHKFVQRLDLGASMAETLTPPWLVPYVDAYNVGMGQHSLGTRPEYIERVCVNGEVQIAGTFDRITLDHNGQLQIADLKTAKLESIQYAWLEISIQLASYANADMVWDFETKRYTPMAEFAPNLDKRTALVLHLPNDVPANKASLIVYEIDLVKGWECAQLAFEVQARRSASKRYVRLRVPPQAPAPAVASPSTPVHAEPAPAQSSVPVEAVILATPGNAPSQPVPESTPEVGDKVTVDGIEFTRVGYAEALCTECGQQPPAMLGARLCAKCAIEYALGKRAVTIGSPSPAERVLMCGNRAELQALWKEGNAQGWWTPELTSLGQEHLARVVEVQQASK